MMFLLSQGQSHRPSWKPQALSQESPPPALCPPPGSACGPGLLPLGLRVKTESIIICKGREGRKEGFCLVKQGERREPKERELGGGK